MPATDRGEGEIGNKYTFTSSPNRKGRPWRLKSDLSAARLQNKTKCVYRGDKATSVGLIGGRLQTFLATLTRPGSEMKLLSASAWRWSSVSPLFTCTSSDDLTGAALIPASPDAWTPYPLYTTELTPGLPHAAFPYPAAAAAAAALHAQVRDQPVCVCVSLTFTSFPPRCQ